MASLCARGAAAQSFWAPLLVQMISKDKAEGFKRAGPQTETMRSDAMPFVPIAAKQGGGLLIAAADVERIACGGGCEAALLITVTVNRSRMTWE